MRHTHDFAPVHSISDLVEEAQYQDHQRLALEDAGEQLKATIYHKTASGSIGKTEGFVTDVNKHGVTYIPARARKERMIMSYYDPFWMVVAGWGHPTPPDPYKVVSKTPEVEVRQGLYRSTDPRWVADFMADIGEKLKPLAVFDSGDFKVHGKVPQKPVAEEAMPMDFPKKLGVMMHNWHGGMGDPIYRIGSMIYAGKSVDPGELEDAVSALERLERKTKAGADRDELTKIIAVLKGEDEI